MPGLPILRFSPRTNAARTANSWRDYHLEAQIDHAPMTDGRTDLQRRLDSVLSIRKDGAVVHVGGVEFSYDDMSARRGEA
jgi:hypothetical protein